MFNKFIELGKYYNNNFPFLKQSILKEIVSKINKDHFFSKKIVFYSESCRINKNIVYIICADIENSSKFMLLLSRHDFASEFNGKTFLINNIFIQKVFINWENTLILHKLFPFTKPISLRDKKTTFGCGDRLGVASCGHIKAIQSYPNVYPVLSQQSMRELYLTGRTYKDVVADVSFQVFQEGFERGYGADGDHLKTISDIDQALDAEIPMITLDLSEKMHPEVMYFSSQAVKKAFCNLPKVEQEFVNGLFVGKQWVIGKKRYLFTQDDIYRCTLAYLDAIHFIKQIDTHIQIKRGKHYDLEISIDETSMPTMPLHHLFLVVCLLKKQVNFTSLAPRFVGEFQKGIDYRGDIQIFRAQFEEHVSIAENFKQYKISVHSGSDKYSVFNIIGKLSNMKIHVKTSGTSWLEALRVIACKNPNLYREIHKKALNNFPKASSYYHVDCNINRIVNIDSVPDEQLVKYLEEDDSRQLVHITYGGVLADNQLKNELYHTLYVYYSILDEYERINIEKHLNGLYDF